MLAGLETVVEEKKEGRKEAAKEIVRK